MKRFLVAMSAISLIVGAVPATAATGADPAGATYCADSLDGYAPATSGGALLCDINSAVKSGTGSSSPFEAVDADGKIFFTATSDEYGEELWITQGTAATTKLVKDIRPGAAGSNLQDLVAYRDRVYFTANNGTNGTELWVSNGTSAGTRMVADIRIGSTGSGPEALTVANDFIYFHADLGPEGRELMQLNPATDTLTAVVVREGAESGVQSGTPMAFFQSQLWFNGERGSGQRFYSLQLSDAGSVGSFVYRGPSPAAELEVTRDGSKMFAVFNRENAGLDLFSFMLLNGTITEVPINLIERVQAGFPSYLTAYEDGIIFLAANENLGGEPFFSRGTPSTTKLIKDLNPGSPGSGPRSFVYHNGEMYFTATLGLTTLMFKWNPANSALTEVGGTSTVQDQDNIWAAALSGAGAVASTSKGLLYRGIAGPAFGSLLGDSGYEPMLAANGLSESSSAPTLSAIAATPRRSTERVLFSGTNLHRIDYALLSGFGDYGVDECRTDGTVCKLEKLSKTSIAITLPFPADDAIGSLEIVSPWGLDRESGLNLNNAPGILRVNSGNPVGAGNATTMTGSRFNGVATMKLGSTAVEPEIASDGRINFTVPAATQPGTYDIELTTKYSSKVYTFPRAMKVVDPLSLEDPTVMSVESTPWPGELMLLLGNKLDQLSNVTLGGIAVEIDIVEDSNNSQGYVRIPLTLGSGSHDLRYQIPGSNETFVFANAVELDLTMSITSVNQGLPAPQGTRVLVDGVNIARTSTATVNGFAVPFALVALNTLQVELPAALADGAYPIRLTNDFGGSATSTVTISAAADAPVGADPGAVGADQEFKVWTKRLNNGEAKMYAKNVVGQGKIQFRLNGEEIAWIRAADLNDRKLRIITEGPMTGAHYLVRTVQLQPGRNVLEIYQDGERIRRTIYSR